MSINESGAECKICGAYNCDYVCIECYNEETHKLQARLKELEEESVGRDFYESHMEDKAKQEQASLDQMNFDKERTDFWNKITEAKAEAYQMIADTFRKWLVSQISDEQLCKVLNISEYDRKILFQEKEATWNSYIGYLVDNCDYPLCKVRQELSAKPVKEG